MYCARSYLSCPKRQTLTPSSHRPQATCALNKALSISCLCRKIKVVAHRFNPLAFWRQQICPKMPRSCPLREDRITNLRWGSAWTWSRRGLRSSWCRNYMLFRKTMRTRSTSRKTISLMSEWDSSWSLRKKRTGWSRTHLIPLLGLRMLLGMEPRLPSTCSSRSWS